MENLIDLELPVAQIGQPAPEFDLEGVSPEGEFKRYSLSAHRGEWTVLFFYPLDFTFVCPTEITAFSERIEELKKLDAVVYGCSTDSVHSHKAWLKDLGELSYPLLSDMTHDVSDAYGVLIPEDGIATRGLFLIDPEGVLRYAAYYDLSVGRSMDEVLRVLTALQTGELCPVNWKPGEGTLGKVD